MPCTTYYTIIEWVYVSGEIGMMADIIVYALL